MFCQNSKRCFSTKNGVFYTTGMKSEKAKSKKTTSAKKNDLQSAEKISAQIKSALKSEGVYSKAMDLAIESCAQVYYLKNRAFEKIRRAQPTVSEKTREGDKRVKANPAYAIFQDLTELGRKMLVELCMTARTSTTATDDDVSKLTRKVAEALR